MRLHWEVGEDVDPRRSRDMFMSDFKDVSCCKTGSTGIDGLTVVPGWPCRGKQIDLVATDHEGRRAIEADGERRHETTGGAQIPEDIKRQKGSCRVPGTASARSDQEVGTLLEKLKAQPTNADLAARMRGDPPRRGGCNRRARAIVATSTRRQALTRPRIVSESAEPERIHNQYKPTLKIYPLGKSGNLMQKTPGRGTARAGLALDDADYLLPARATRSGPASVARQTTRFVPQTSRYGWFGWGARNSLDRPPRTSISF